MVNELIPEKPLKWTARLKATVVKLIEGEILTEEQACKKYELTIEELQSCRNYSAVVKAPTPCIQKQM